MAGMKEDTPQHPSLFFGFLERLQSSQLLMMLTLLFLLDVIIPDPLPFIDEAILGVLTLLVARWQMRSEPPPPKPPPKNVTPNTP